MGDFAIAGMWATASRRVATVSAFRGLRTTAPVCQKATTNLVGLDVVPDAVNVLKGLYAETLEATKTLPASTDYRINVEKITNYRLKTVTDAADIDSIEIAVGVQVEEMIVEAKDELALIPKRAEWKPWEGEAPATEQAN